MNEIDEDLLSLGLQEAMKDGVSYADIKFMSRTSQSLLVKNNQLENNEYNQNMGVGIKILYKGAYGFAATNNLSKTSIQKLAQRAYRVAKASAMAVKRPIQLAEEPTHVDTVITKMAKDPDKVDITETISLLMDATKEGDINDSRIKSIMSRYQSWKDHMVLWTSEGSKIDQTICVVGGMASTLSSEGSETQRRSHPASFRGNFATAGYEFFESLDLVNSARKASEESLALLGAEQCPAANDATLIIRPSQLMLQLHENFHGAELDRALDYEAAFAGTSFLKPHLLNKLQFGSEIINIYADATREKGLGTYYYDHEGVKALAAPEDLSKLRNSTASQFREIFWSCESDFI